MLAILSAGIAPGLALLSYFYLKDEYDVEPISFVFKTFIFGALIVFPLMFIQYILQIELQFQSSFFQAFISTSALEEFFKWFILYYMVFKHFSFDEPYDGIVYGAAVSLGFASAENILYLVGNGFEHALGRALLPVSSHALFGVMMGYYLGKGKFDIVKKRKWILLSVIVPFLLHGIYDYILVSQSNWIRYIVPFMIFLWWLGLRKVKKAKCLSSVHFENKLGLSKTLPL